MFRYAMSATGRAFHECDKFVKILCGPYGSGKSCCCAVDVLSYACAQAPASDGVRYSRVGVVRSTYPELTAMTRRSLMEVLPAECGTITGAVAPLRGFYKIPLVDGTLVNLEIEMFAMKTEDDCDKILSANWTFAWINEATGVAPDVFNAVMKRTQRYPSLDLGGVSWGGIIMDFNQPERGSWLDLLMKNPPANYGVFVQPPAAFQHDDTQGRKYYTVNPDAENLRNLGGREEGDPTLEEIAAMSDDDRAEYLQMKGMRYYQNQIDSHLRAGREDIVQNMYCMLDVPIIDGKPVYTNFSKVRHIATEEIKPIMFHDILIGMDQSGIHPAAVVLQHQYGKWCVLDELYADGEGFENFLYGMLIPLLRAKYATNPVVAAIDPSNKRDDWQAVTPRARLEAVGIAAVTEITNSPKARIQMVEHMLNLDTGGLLISPVCENLIRGFIHEYRYRKLRAGGSIGAAYTPAPEKNESSHYHDALQYAALLIHQGTRSGTDSMMSVARQLSDKRRIMHRVV